MVASNLADGVQESHRFEPEAESRACAVIFTFLVSIHTNANYTTKVPLFLGISFYVS